MEIIRRTIEWNAAVNIISGLCEVPKACPSTICANFHVVLDLLLKFA